MCDGPVDEDEVCYLSGPASIALVMKETDVSARRSE